METPLTVRNQDHWAWHGVVCVCMCVCVCVCVDVFMGVMIIA